MAKAKNTAVFFCQECGYESVKWMGQCPGCKTWNSFVEEKIGAGSEGTTLFVTTHYLDEAEYCNRVSIMVDGRIDALDSPAALKARYGAYTMDEVFRKVAVAKNTEKK